MYIFWLDFPSPGIEPRMPTVFGSSGGSHTSIVAHSSCELKSARSLAVGLDVFAEPGVDADAGAVADTASTVSVAGVVASARSAAGTASLARAARALRVRFVLTM
jgi:hypothetical protein